MPFRNASAGGFPMLLCLQDQRFEFWGSWQNGDVRSLVGKRAENFRMVTAGH